MALHYQVLHGLGGVAAAKEAAVRRGMQRAGVPNPHAHAPATTTGSGGGSSDGDARWAQVP
jgi:hypothetical protein